MAGGRRGDGQGPFWGDLVGPNPTDRGKNGVKRSLLVEADGGPLSVVVAGANVRDDKLLAATLDAVVLERSEPTEEAPHHLCLDKGYDIRPTRELVQERGYVAHVRRIGEEKLDEAVGSGAHAGTAVEVPGDPGALREEGRQLPSGRGYHQRNSRFSSWCKRAEEAITNARSPGAISARSSHSTPCPFR